MDGLLNGKVAIVTGSTSGIGEATVKLLAKEGAKVVVVGPDKEKDIESGNRIVNGIVAEGGQAVFIKCELTDVSQIEALIDQTIETYGQLDILHNNAGIAFTKPIEETSVEMWDTLIDVNLRSYFFTIKYALPHLIKSGNGVIINTSSGAGLKPMKQLYVYGASKAGVIMMTKTIAFDYGDRGIRANVICPGTTNTPILEDVSQELKDSLIPNIPLRRIGEPEEIAEMVLFLASDKAKYVSGQVIGVNGGSA